EAGQDLCGLRTDDHLAPEVGARLGRGPLVLAGLPAQGAAAHRRGPRAERARPAGAAGRRRDDLPLGSGPGGRGRRLAPAHGAGPRCRPQAGRARARRDHPGRARRRPVDGEGADPGAPHPLGM
ncbi:MAG: Uncharacterized protein RSP_6119, partial [uncultured Frankineae bacterium]